jgi:hypothetical protein
MNPCRRPSTISVQLWKFVPGDRPGSGAALAQGGRDGSGGFVGLMVHCASIYYNKSYFLAVDLTSSIRPPIF